VRENEVVERVGASWEHSEADHAHHDLIATHVIDLLLKLEQVGPHAITLMDESREESAGQVEVAGNAHNIQ